MISSSILQLQLVLEDQWGGPKHAKLEVMHHIQDTTNYAAGGGGGGGTFSWPPELQVILVVQVVVGVVDQDAFLVMVVQVEHTRKWMDQQDQPWSKVLVEVVVRLVVLVSK